MSLNSLVAAMSVATTQQPLDIPSSKLNLRQMASEITMNIASFESRAYFLQDMAQKLYPL